ALAGSPHLAGLTRLRLGRYAHDLSPEALGALASSPLLGRLTELATCPAFLDGGGRRPGPLAELLRSPRLAGLRSLSLRRSLRFEADLEALLTSPHLSGVRALDLRNCQLGVDQARALASARHLDGLVELDLSASFSSQADA